MPRLNTETIGAGDQSWLGSTHGITNCRTATLNASAFTAATHYPDGHIRSGQPLAEVGGLAVPYDPAGTDGSEVLLGFLFTDQPTDGTTNVAVPVLRHGFVKADRLPVDFTAPATAPGFVFVGGAA